MLYGAVHCNTQELECETINIFLISINNKQSLEGIIQDAEYEKDVFQNFFYITVYLLYTTAQNPGKILLTELSCIPFDRQSCFNIDAKYMWSRIDVVDDDMRVDHSDVTVSARK